MFSALLFLVGLAVLSLPIVVVYVTGWVIQKRTARAVETLHQYWDNWLSPSHPGPQQIPSGETARARAAWKYLKKYCYTQELNEHAYPHLRQHFEKNLFMLDHPAPA